MTGKFVWHDLMTADPAGAEAFYAALFGWTVREMEMGSFGTYRMIFAGEQSIGGFVKLEQGEVPSHWIAYVTVDEVDAACKRAEAAGGTTCVPPTDIPEVGRFAVITDPAGAVISPFASFSGGDSEGAEDTPAAAPGTFCWEELLTKDVEGAKRFYPEVFGWKVKPFEVPGMGPYTIFARGETDTAGVMQMPTDAEARSHWLPYLAVENVDASAKHAEELGAKRFVPPTDIPNVGRFSVLADPTGAMFALFAR